MHKKSFSHLVTDRLPQGSWFPSTIIFAGAMVWGFYWFPLRYVEEAGLSGVWSIFAINIIPFLALLPLVFLRRRKFSVNLAPLAIIGFFTGLGIVCYSVSLLYSSIMRATMLFYLTPVWSTLLAYFLLRERTGWQRWVAILVGLIGLFLMLSAASDIDNSSVLGNIAGLCSGFFWGLGTVALRRWPHIGPAESVSTQFFFASAASFAFVLALEDGFVALPELSVWVKAVPPIIGYYILLVIPSLFALFWAAQRVSPGRTGILMMSEVIVAAITAAWLAGEVMSFQETLGAVFIVAAGLFEVIGSPEPSQSA